MVLGALVAAEMVLQNQAVPIPFKKIAWNTRFIKTHTLYAIVVLRRPVSSLGSEPANQWAGNGKANGKLNGILEVPASQGLLIDK